MISLWTLQSPYLIPGLVPTDLKDSLISSDILLIATSFLKILSTRFSCLTAKLWMNDGILNDGILNFSVNQEKPVDNILKKLFATNSISEETRKSLELD